MTYDERDKALMPLLEKQQKIADKTRLFCGLVVWVSPLNPDVLEHRDMYSSHRMEVEEWADSMYRVYQNEVFSIYIDGQYWIGRGCIG